MVSLVGYKPTAALSNLTSRGGHLGVNDLVIDYDVGSSSTSDVNSPSIMSKKEFILLIQRAMSHIASATSDPSSKASIDSGTNFLIFLEDSKDEHVTSRCPFITNVKEFFASDNSKFVQNYVINHGGRHGYRRYLG